MSPLFCKCIHRPALVANLRDQFHLPQLKRASGNVGMVSCRSSNTIMKVLSLSFSLSCPSRPPFSMLSSLHAAALSLDLFHLHVR